LGPTVSESVSETARRRESALNPLKTR
jgi:hypothetical protein